ncbi:MAG TPA: hypothetical protein VF518_05105, partial [Polyangia bacterium]
IFSRSIAGLFSKNDPQLIEMVRQGLPWFVVPLMLFGLSGTMAHYFLAIHEPRKAALLLLGRELLSMSLFIVLPRLLGFYGMYLVGPIAALPFASLAALLMVRELAKLRQTSAANRRSVAAQMGGQP